MNKQQYFEMVYNKEELITKRSEMDSAWDNIWVEGTMEDVRNFEKEYDEVQAAIKALRGELAKAKAEFTEDELRGMKKEYEAWKVEREALQAPFKISRDENHPCFVTVEGEGVSLTYYDMGNNTLKRKWGEVNGVKLHIDRYNDYWIKAGRGGMKQKEKTMNMIREADTYMYNEGGFFFNR
ncbi:hypothetical protein [Bacillus thuringiensis]|uniref:hypothetical protein n=1 Tax=Bacillus thuringiensis TaxID=1428 RepID=UPI000BFCCDD7|nr:hypothetical protein [Bacillus thuringiensis]PGM50820.1 hypothetical protein CN949_16140 [Bacillus thuringiensis]